MKPLHTPTLQQSVPTPGRRDPRAFEGSLARGREPGHAHSMNFSFLSQSILLSASIKREGDSPTASPHSSDDIHHSDRYQVSRQTPALLSLQPGSQLAPAPAALQELPSSVPVPTCLQTGDTLCPRMATKADFCLQGPPSSGFEPQLCRTA